MRKGPSRMRFLSYFSAVFFSLAFSAAAVAHADTINTFTLNASLEYGTATGTLVVDSTTGLLKSGSVTASYNGQSESLSTVVSSTGSNGLYTIELTTASGGTGDDLYLDLPTSTLSNYGGGIIDSASYNALHESYLNAYNTMDYVTSGTLNLTGTAQGAASPAATPEVASWVFTLTGTALLVAVARRRRTAVSASAAQ